MHPLSMHVRLIEGSKDEPTYQEVMRMEDGDEIKEHWINTMNKELQRTIRQRMF